MRKRQTCPGGKIARHDKATGFCVHTFTISPPHFLLGKLLEKNQTVSELTQTRQPAQSPPHKIEPSSQAAIFSYTYTPVNPTFRYPRGEREGCENKKREGRLHPQRNSRFTFRNHSYILCIHSIVPSQSSKIAILICVLQH